MRILFARTHKPCQFLPDCTLIYLSGFCCCRGTVRIELSSSIVQAAVRSAVLSTTSKGWSSQVRRSVFQLRSSRSPDPLVALVIDYPKTKVHEWETVRIYSKSMHSCNDVSAAQNTAWHCITSYGTIMASYGAVMTSCDIIMTSLWRCSDVTWFMTLKKSR